MERAHLCSRSPLPVDSSIDDIPDAISFHSDVHTQFDSRRVLIILLESGWVARFWG